MGLSVYNANLLLEGQWALPAISSEIDFQDFRVLLGFLIVVQGFETSRYLGDEHPAEQRIATMRAAQILSALIYLVFIGLATVGKTDANLTEIGLKLGYANPGNFTRAFRKWAGVGPGEFRRQRKTHSDLKPDSDGA